MNYEGHSSKPRIARGLLLAGLGVATAAAVVVLAYIDTSSEQPRFSLALLVVLALVAVSLVAMGVATLRSARERAIGEIVAPADYRHTYPLFGLLIVGVLGAVGARSLAVPESFGAYGYYRGDAPREAQTERVPRHQGKQVCAECHDFQFEAHEKDVHRTVQCENCHGPADRHVQEASDPNVAKPGHVEVIKSKELCLVCHRQLQARMGFFPQVSWQDHYRFVGVRDQKVECIECHDPHEPLFLTKPLPEARLHPLIHRCRDCHIGRVDETLKRPAEHPAIFECSYCHAARVKDFETRPHHEVRCTACHLFLRDSDFAGRIVRNASPDFCLLCHGQAPFRSGEAAPGIEWPKHLTDVKSTATDETTCLPCHEQAIHGEHKESQR